MALEQFRLDGCTAVVTGAASGLGEAIARQFATVGAHVVLLDINGEALHAVAQDIVAEGGRSESIVGSVAVESDVASAVDAAVKITGRLDVMANIAGVAARQSIEELDEAFLDRLYSVHLKGSAWGTKHAIRAMRSGGFAGSIINCASAAMDCPDDGLAPYAAMKAGICAFSRVAAKEAGKHNIRCNVISPGLIVTPMTRRYGIDENGRFDQARFDEFVDSIKSGNALDRAGDTGDIASAALYLASKASKYVTGQILRVNGGAFMA
ncbi:SDR family NAD(P)-dependent oxidoreductase [Novosphingobium pentaromativorans]|uniref:Short-chain dehydrogenase/reductase SDR n=1 Tax=Novosphingobium pentaromativorans US6-1 TaxID=1088721 RepID=G6EGI0_9SPHN|nr:SDR family NAD(P)-dependent oxidoreductase [Novosphingobium pentaromativorans]AIT82105.1 hypothetical protein JI59_21455 [Novosphingobium pentaromativorans US6-1]EHJ59631.1 hypothetical protein NSU_3514 [Novosphingobium pentaromativorans US6-1]